MKNLFSDNLSINHSVLSGAIDIIVIEHPDGSLHSSPFHVRFGQSQILNTSGKSVSVIVNKVRSDLTMKLSENGDAYFPDPLSEDDVQLQEVSNDDIQGISGRFSMTDQQFSPVKNHRRSVCDNNNLEFKLVPFEQPISRKSEKLNSNKFIRNQSSFKEKYINELIEADNKKPEITEFVSYSINEMDDSGDDQGKNEQNNNLLDEIKNEFDNSDKSKNFDFSQIIDLSNCWKQLQKNKNPDKIEEIFNENIVTKLDFFKDPIKILDNKNLVVRYEDKLYPYSTSVPLLISILAFGERLPNYVIEKLLNKKNNFFSFFRKNRNPLILNKTNSPIKSPDIQNVKKYSNEVPKLTLNNSNEQDNQEIMVNSSPKRSNYCLNPTSESLRNLKLKKGKNEIIFTTKSRLQGSRSISCDLYLWDSSSKIVISDVDGTITKSDVFGQLMPLIGKDWSHEGVAELYNNIIKNNYKILYLTSRSIAQSDQTKSYLGSLVQNNVKLPEGPILMSPDGIFTSFKREVIDREPQKFKIACLTQIYNLFPKGVFPFFAGFGNRETDVISYEAVEIDKEKIFIINKKGEITMINDEKKKSYAIIREKINMYFPKFLENSFADEWNDFSIL